MKCLNCNKEFEAKRTDAKFCSSLCRVTHNRVTDKSVTDKLPVIVTDNETDIVTDKVSIPTDYPKPTLNTPEHLKEYTDHCHFCNHKFGTAPDGEQLMGYICANCITRAMNSEK